MDLVAAKCTNCGAKIVIDSTKRIIVCPFCGTNYTEDKGHAVNEYKILLIMLNNLDIKSVKKITINLLKKDPDNSFIRMIYDCDIKFNCRKEFLILNEIPMRNFFLKELGKVEVDICKVIFKLLLLTIDYTEVTDEIVALILQNISYLDNSENRLFNILFEMTDLVMDKSMLSTIKQVVKQIKIKEIFKNKINDFSLTGEHKEILLNSLEK